MTNFKPLILISKCLSGAPCRYNGEGASSKFISDLSPFVNFKEICPETDIGLTTPRNSLRLININDEIHILDPKENLNHTKLMTEYATELCLEISKEPICGVILKSRSPSCGPSDVKIYSSDGKGSAYKKGKGLVAEQILKNFSYFPIEDDGRLNNFTIRNNFLMRIFLLSSFKEFLNTNSLSYLNEFHSKNKLLLMCFGQKSTKELGGILANHNNLSNKQVFFEYNRKLSSHISNYPRYTYFINVFNHAIGYFNEYLSKKELEYLLKCREDYRNGKLPYIVLIHLLKMNAIRFNNNYLLNQTLLNPYPEELINLTDSGKGVVR